jgi:ABC-type branched-subunit amino acid transport system ATPase component
MVNHILATRGLCKDFVGLRALDHLDIQVREGDIHGLIGPNGSGKSTFFNVVSGVLPATGGEITFQASNITNLQSHRIAAMGMSRTFQSGKLAPNLSVLENVMNGAYSTARPDILGTFFHLPFRQSRREKEIRRIASEALELSRVGGKAARPDSACNGSQAEAAVDGRTDRWNGKERICGGGEDHPQNQGSPGNNDRGGSTRHESGHRDF